MKKILSAFLMVVVTLQVATMDVLALGKDEVVWNSDGSKSTFISSDKVEDYIKNLELEISQCWAKRDNWNESESWKRILLDFAPFLVPTVFATIHINFMKFILNYAKRYRQHNNIVNSEIDSSVNIESLPPSKVEKALSILLTVGLFVGIPVLALISYYISRQYSDIAMTLDCDELQDHHKMIVQDLSFEKDKALTYGIEIVENPKADILKILARSQYRFYDPLSKDYDPKFANKLELLRGEL